MYIYLYQHLPVRVLFDSKGWCIQAPLSSSMKAPFGRYRYIYITIYVCVCVYMYTYVFIICPRKATPKKESPTTKHQWAIDPIELFDGKYETEKEGFWYFKARKLVCFWKSWCAGEEMNPYETTKAHEQVSVWLLCGSHWEGCSQNMRFWLDD